VEGTSQAVLGSSDQRKVSASLSLFLKSEKNQVLSTGPSVIFRLVPEASTQALLLYSKKLLLEQTSVIAFTAHGETWVVPLGSILKKNLNIKNNQIIHLVY
jgi:hypothetical protein